MKTLNEETLSMLVSELAVRQWSCLGCALHDCLDALDESTEPCCTPMYSNNLSGWTPDEIFNQLATLRRI